MRDIDFYMKAIYINFELNFIVFWIYCNQKHN